MSYMFYKAKCFNIQENAPWYIEDEIR